MKKMFKLLIFRIVNRYQNLILSNIRSWLNNRISNLTDNIIQQGLFKGQKIEEFPWWSNADKGNILLGLYEKEIQSVILNKYKKYDNFIDIGAADGYYLFGLAQLNFFKQFIAFEASDLARFYIEQKIQKFNFNNIKCYGKADSGFINLVDLEAKNFILCDIEGYEFEIFNDYNLSKLKNCLIVIEIHSKGVECFSDKYNLLISNASKYFNIDYVYTSSRDLSSINLIKRFSDNQRWLLCSEGRSNLGSWIVLNPK